MFTAIIAVLSVVFSLGVWAKYKWEVRQSKKRELANLTAREGLLSTWASLNLSFVGNGEAVVNMHPDYRNIHVLSWVGSNYKPTAEWGVFLMNDVERLIKESESGSVKSAKQNGSQNNNSNNNQNVDEVRRQAFKAGVEAALVSYAHYVEQADGSYLNGSRRVKLIQNGKKMKAWRVEAVQPAVPSYHPEGY